MADIPRYEWKIDLNDGEQGVKVISLVDDPAMESEFIAFKKQKTKPKFVAFEKEGYKNTVAGLALIPDKDIPRVDENGDPYIGYFSAETIEDIRNKFHFEQQDQNVNVDHEENETVDAYLIESYIVNSDLQVEDLKNKGIEEATIGSWFVAYKITDDAIFEKALEDEYNGFSVELYANRILESLNNNNKNKFSIMKKFFEKLQNLVDEFKDTDDVKLEDEVKLERAPVPSLEIIVEWGEVGEVVNSVVTDESGEEVLEPVEDGDYELEDGKILVVSDGVLAEIKEPATEEPEEMPENEEMETEEVKAEDEIEVPNLKDVLTTLGINFESDGYHYIEVSVEGGEPTWAVLSSSTYKEIKFNHENFKKTIDETVSLKKEIEALKKKIKEPVTDPKLGFETEKEEEVDLSKLSNFERIARKNNLPVV